MVKLPKRIPWWLKIDAMIFAAGLAIIAVGIYIANARISGSHLDQARDESVRDVDTN
jgi:hypothetical protein